MTGRELTTAERFLDEDKALACVHCGLCLSACPTYLETGDENDSPRGRVYLMRAVQDGRLPLDDPALRHIDLCLGCRACETACPSGVQYGTLLEHTRDHIERYGHRTIPQRLLRRVAIEQIFPYPLRLKLALFPVRVIRKLGATRLLPRFFRDALSLIPETFRAGNLAAISAVPRGVTQRGTVGFISGCVMNVVFGPTNENTIRLLNCAGFEVITPAAQVCCGALHAHSGQLAEARSRARRNISVFERLDVDAVIINAAGCGSTLKDYANLLENEPAWAKRAAEFSRRVKDLTEWLATPEFLALLKPQHDGPKVTYHDACHLAHPQRISKAPRDLVKAVTAPRFVELPEADICCGSAGSYNLTEPAMAARLQERKINHILSTGAQLVVTTNPGCILQIHAGLNRAGASQIRVQHLADFLAENLSQDCEVKER